MRTELVITLKRRTTELPSEIARHKEPILIKRHGLSSAYLIDIGTYERMLRRMTVLEGIVQGEQALAESQVATHTAAKERLARWK